MLRKFTTNRTHSTSLCVLAVLSLNLPASTATAGQRDRNLERDRVTCLEFGNRYGTPAYSDCMLAQQRRRDVKKLESLEQSRLLSQIARDGQIMAERARKDRCRRDPDRRECRR
jgi:hypothetical protein